MATQCTCFTRATRFAKLIQIFIDFVFLEVGNFLATQTDSTNIARPFIENSCECSQHAFPFRCCLCPVQGHPLVHCLVWRQVSLTKMEIGVRCEGLQNFVFSFSFCTLATNWLIAYRFAPVREYFNHIGTSPLPVRSCKRLPFTRRLRPSSRGIFIVPYLRWHRTSIYMIHPKDPPV